MEEYEWSTGSCASEGDLVCLCVQDLAHHTFSSEFYSVLKRGHEH